MIRAEVFTLRVPLRDARAGAVQTVLLRLTAADGTVGLGESAAAPSIDGIEADTIAGELRDHLLSPLDSEKAFSPLLRALSPPARCALDTALHDLRARRQGIRVADLLGGPCRASVPVNALVPRVPIAEAIAWARDAWRRGIRTFKIKSSDRDADAALLGALRGAFGPAALLRIDANGSWTVEEAIARIRALAPLDLEYVEEPVKPGDLTGMARVARETGVRLAADEDARDAEAVRLIAASGAARIIVVKLAVAGGIAGAMEILQASEAAGLGVVITSRMDTSIGIAAALHLAASAKSLAGACGLATRDHLADDVTANPPRVEDGKMTLPEGPGLGVRLDPEALDRLQEGGEA